MAWTRDIPILRVAQKMLNLQMRAERLQLVQRVESLERQAQAQGIDSTPLRQAAEALAKEHKPYRPDAVDKQLVAPPKSPGVWRKTYLSVRLKPGSVF